MNEDFVPFALPDVGEAEVQAVAEAIRSQWLSSGPRVKLFEAQFASRIAPDVQAIAVNSATAGLHLALESLGVTSGDEVLVPTWTFTATAEVVRYLGAEPILVDIDAQTLSIDYEAAAQRVTPRTKAVVPVHFAGLPIDPMVTSRFAEAHGLQVVEDAAHAFPASVRGQSVGASESASTVFSFYATKTLTTGEGGMICTRDPRLADRIRVMRTHGISRDSFDRYRTDVPSWFYEVVAPGFKYNLTDPAAAMGIVQLSRAASMHTRRMAIAQKYTEAFADLAVEVPLLPTDDVEHAWHLYVLRLPLGYGARDEFIRRMTTAGVGCSVHFIPLHKHPYWRDRGSHRDEDFPIATAEFERVVSLPLFSGMTEAQVDRVITNVQEILA